VKYTGRIANMCCQFQSTGLSRAVCGCETSYCHGGEYEDWDIVLLEHADVSEVRTVPMIVVMEAVRTSETSVYSNETTRRYIPEGSNLRSRYLFIWSYLIKKSHITMKRNLS